MTEQELRDEFYKFFEEYNKIYKNGFYERDDYVRFFKAGYSLAQETIAEIESRLEQSVDIGVVNQLNETIEKQKKEQKLG